MSANPTRPRASRRAAALVLTTLVLLAGACADGGAGDGAAEDATSTSTSASSSETTGAATTECSASDLDADLREQPGLPRAVAETRRQIARAAVACDYDALETLAREGDDAFTYSFGESGEPAAFWQRQEAESGARARPLRFLVGVLDRPHGVVEHHGTVRYAWPSAFTHDSWEEVPGPERDALEPLYGEEDFAFFERFGGYVGYRVLIDEDGTWTAFVAGD